MQALVQCVQWQWPQADVKPLQELGAWELALLRVLYRLPQRWDEPPLPQHRARLRSKAVASSFQLPLDAEMAIAQFPATWWHVYRQQARHDRWMQWAPRPQPSLLQLADWKGPHQLNLGHLRCPQWLDHSVDPPRPITERQLQDLATHLPVGGPDWMAAPSSTMHPNLLVHYNPPSLHACYRAPDQRLVVKQCCLVRHLQPLALYPVRCVDETTFHHHPQSWVAVEVATPALGPLDPPPPRDQTLNRAHDFRWARRGFTHLHVCDLQAILTLPTAEPTRIAQVVDPELPVHLFLHILFEDNKQPLPWSATHADVLRGYLDIIINQICYQPTSGALFHPQASCQCQTPHPNTGPVTHYTLVGNHAVFHCPTVCFVDLATMNAALDLILERIEGFVNQNHRKHKNLFAQMRVMRYHHHQHLRFVQQETTTGHLPLVVPGTLNSVASDSICLSYSQTRLFLSLVHHALLNIQHGQIHLWLVRDGMWSWQNMEPHGHCKPRAHNCPLPLELEWLYLEQNPMARYFSHSLLQLADLRIDKNRIQHFNDIAIWMGHQNLKPQPFAPSPRQERGLVVRQWQLDSDQPRRRNRRSFWLVWYWHLPWEPVQDDWVPQVLARIGPDRFVANHSWLTTAQTEQLPSRASWEWHLLHPEQTTQQLHDLVRRWIQRYCASPVTLHFQSSVPAPCYNLFDGCGVTRGRDPELPFDCVIRVRPKFEKLLHIMKQTPNMDRIVKCTSRDAHWWFSMCWELFQPYVAQFRASELQSKIQRGRVPAAVVYLVEQDVAVDDQVWREWLGGSWSGQWTFKGVPISRMQVQIWVILGFSYNQESKSPKSSIASHLRRHFRWHTFLDTPRSNRHAPICNCIPFIYKRPRLGHGAPDIKNHVGDSEVTNAIEW